MNNSVIHIHNYEEFIHGATKVLQSLEADERATVMYSDVTGFQLVNDFYGFMEGDRFLEQLDHLFAGFARTVVSGRVFSDHFLRLAIIKEDTDISQIMQEMTQKMEQFLAEQRIYHLNCRLMLSCGYCIVEHGAKGLLKAIDDANLARKEAKGTKQTVINWFDNAMRQKINNKKNMEIDIQAALMNEEFIFYLQPKVNLNTGKVVGAEALARWVKNDGTPIYPDTFVPIMERNGTIIELDFMIYRKVCAYLKDKLDHKKETVPISVNMSRIHIYQMDFARKIHTIAQQYGIPSYLLEFEITETVLLDEFDDAKNVIDELRQFGYKVSIDDFGTGFTGLNIWKQLEFDIIKLDKSFISEKPIEMKNNDSIIMAVTYVGRMQKTVLLCEGVETQEQCRHMKELGCEIAQGYYFSRPIPTKEFDRIMKEKNWYYPIFFADSKQKEEHVQSVEEWKRLQIDNFYREIYDLVDCAIVEYQEDPNKEGTFECLSWNNYAAELFGYSERDIILSEKIDIINQFILPEDILSNVDKITRLKSTGDSILLDFRIRRVDGTIRYVTGTLKVIFDMNGKQIYLAVLMDKSDRQEVEHLKNRLNRVIDRTQRRYLEAAKMLRTDVWNYDFTKKIIELPVTEEFSDLDLQGKKQLSLSEFVETGCIHPDYIHTFLGMFAEIQHGAITVQRDVLVRIRTGQYQWFHITGRAIAWDQEQNPIEMVGVSKNVHGEKMRQKHYQELKVKAMKDSLTGFCNRETACLQIQEKMKELANSKKISCFFLLDIDNFKSINDNFGHWVGDKVLQAICRKLERLLPSNSVLGRLGGDEFILFISGFIREQQIQRMAENICHALNTILIVEYEEGTISVSIGIACVEKNINFDELYRRADKAMYLVKHQNKNGYHIWKPIDELE